jgi:hypothetical protein
VKAGRPETTVEAVMHALQHPNAKKLARPLEPGEARWIELRRERRRARNKAKKAKHGR